MDGELYKATIEGNIEALLKLIDQDPLILDRTTTITTYLETPLHVATIRGHEGFVAELLKIKPELTSELDYRRSSPLHLASLRGHMGIVKNLLRINPDMCLACDRDGRNPLHVAAMMGRVDAMMEMLRVMPEAARAFVDRDKTVLHLCVEYSQFEALKLLVETTEFQNLVNSKDKNGNTVLHLSIADKQVKTTKLLLSITGIEINATNLNGMTPMDILIQRRMDTRDLDMEESLKRVGGYVVRESADRPTFFPTQKKVRSMSLYPNQCQCSSNDFQRIIYKKLIKNNDDWLDKKRSAMMVVATLIASMAFQVGTNPPERIFNTDTDNTISERPGDIKYYIMFIYVNLKEHVGFYLVNTTGFIASLSIIFLLMSGLPLKNKFFMWILTAIIWIAITAVALTYTVSLVLLTPPNQKISNGSIIGITVFVWICLMGLLLVGHTTRLLFKTIKVIVKTIKAIAKALTAKRKKPIHQQLGI